MPKHKIVHVEFPTESFEESSEFYKNVFGWETKHHPEADYTSWSPGGEAMGGGFSKIDGESVRPGDVLVYISTDDIEASLKKIVEAGGEVLVPKTEISPDFGNFAIFKDNAGNTIALHSM